MVREVPKNPIVTLIELQSFSVEMVVLLEGSRISAALTNQVFMVEWPDGSLSSVKGT